MKRMASVDARRERLLVASWWATEGNYPVFVLGDWAEAVREPASDEVVGRLVRSALVACREGVPYPDLRSNPEGKRRMARLLKLAGVRSQIAYGRGARHVSVRWDDAERDMTVKPSRTDGTGGFSGIKDQDITVSAGIDDAELGAVIRRAIAASVGI
jgi:hypothetical protein